jgi:prevent-host-death family protein
LFGWRATPVVFAYNDLLYTFPRSTKGAFPMSPIAIDISEFTGKIKELIVRLQRDEEIVITANSHPVARLVAVEEKSQETPPRRRAGLTEGSAWMSPDFNEPLEDFAEYMP